jgi:hypothetical protein
MVQRATAVDIRGYYVAGLIRTDENGTPIFITNSMKDFPKDQTEAFRDTRVIEMEVNQKIVKDGFVLTLGDIEYLIKELTETKEQMEVLQVTEKLSE